MTMTNRMIPPSNGSFNPITINGKVYSCAANGTIDVPDHIADVMAANGWVKVAAGGADVTANRPTAATTPGLKPGYHFHDTTLGLTIVWDGKVWRNPNTGAQV